MDHRPGLRDLLAAEAHRAPLSDRTSGSRACSGSTAALGYRFVAGADEAGRGCLAGPLVAAAVLFDYETALAVATVRSLSALNDSKQHTLEMREMLVPARAAGRGQGRGHVALRARDRRARAAQDEPGGVVGHAAPRRRSPAALCLSDGFPVPPTGFEQRQVVGGDATSAAIAAASVIAKVTRDRFMQRMEERYPGWEFAAHVGYSTPEHRAAIEKLGVSPLHRLSFQSMAYQQLAL